MINSDFRLNFKVDRYKLHDKLVDLGLLSNYDPENYPGVKIYYFFGIIMMVLRIRVFVIVVKNVKEKEMEQVMVNVKE